jgi:Spy/CpxP family protein refolding chaperone
MTNSREIFLRIGQAAKMCGVIVIMQGCSSIALPAFADGKCPIDWNKLNLTPGQKQQIDQIEAQWQRELMEIKPAIVDDQHKLTKKLGEHCDQLEVIALQESIQRKQNQLRQLAMMTVLKKKLVLNENQQRNMEAMLNTAIAARQRELNPGSEQRVMPDQVQDLIQRVRNVFPVNEVR